MVLLEINFSAESTDIANTVGLWDPIMEFRSVHWEFVFYS